MARAVQVRGLTPTAQLVGLTGDLKTNTVSVISLCVSLLVLPCITQRPLAAQCIHLKMQINATVVLKQTKSSVIEILFEINLETVLLSSSVLIQTFGAALTWMPTHHKQKWIGIPHFIFHHLAVV